MDYSDVAWAQSRKGIYSFLVACLAHDPAFQFILALLDQNMERDFQQAELFCPSMTEFKNTLQSWKNDTKVRRKVREDYAQLSEKCNGQKELSRLLKEIAHLVTQEEQARQKQLRGQTQELLIAQKQFLEIHFLSVQRSLLHEMKILSTTEFYRTLTNFVEEFIFHDYEKLSKSLAMT